jgi:hypothetical protein
MTEGQVVADFVAVTATLANPGEVTGLFQVRDNALHGPFGDADQVGDVAHPNLGLSRQTEKDMGVIGQKSPRGQGFDRGEADPATAGRVRGSSFANNCQGRTS